MLLTIHPKGTAKALYSSLRDTPRPQKKKKRKRKRQPPNTETLIMKSRVFWKGELYMCYVSTRIEHINTQNACWQIMHDMRLRPPAYLQGDSNALTYLHGTEEPIEGKGNREELLGKDYDKYRKTARSWITNSAKEQKERYKNTVGQNIQKTTRNFIKGVITFSPEGFPLDINELIICGKKFLHDLSQKLEVKPIYLSVHLDETTPHFHFMMENGHIETGKSVARNISPNDCKEMQDLAGNIFGHLGFKRGISRDVTGAHHKSVRQAHRIEQKLMEEELQKTKEELNTLKNNILTSTAILVKERELTDDTSAQLTEKSKKLAACEADLYQSKKELEKVKKELKAHRASQETYRQMAKEERNTYNREVKELRNLQRKLKEEIKSLEEKLKNTEKKINEYGDSVQLAEKVDSLTSYIKDRGLEEDYEDWANAYKEALEYEDRF